jgi:hypothetical protein
MAWANTKRRFLIQVTGVTVISLTAIDLMGGMSGIAISILCNFVGGAILALISLVIVANVPIIRFVSDGNKYIERFFWVIWPAFCYLIFACALFLILQFVIKIPSSTISIRLSSPVAGYASSVDSMQCALFKASSGDSANCENMASSKDNDADRFGVISDFNPVKGSEKKWLGFGKGLAISWKKKNSNLVSVSYRMVQGCQTKDELNHMLKLPPFEKDVAIGALLVQADKGLSQFQILDTDYTGRIKLDDKDTSVSEFWIGPSTVDPSKLLATRFVMDGTLHFTEQFRTINYEVGLSPFGDEKGDRPLAARRLNLLEGSSQKPKFIDVKFDNSPVNPSLALSCKELKLRPSPDGYIGTAVTPSVSLIVSIDNEKEVAYNDIDNPDIIEVKGMNGWVSNDGFEKLRLDNIVKPGKLGMLSVFGVISDVQVNEKVFSVGPTSTIQLSGKFDAKSDGPSILITGEADYMVLNDHRMTATRWESLDTEMRVAIIVGVPASLVFLLALMREALKRPMRHLWYLPK